MYLLCFLFSFFPIQPTLCISTDCLVITAENQASYIDPQKSGSIVATVSRQQKGSFVSPLDKRRRCAIT